MEDIFADLLFVLSTITEDDVICKFDKNSNPIIFPIMIYPSANVVITLSSDFYGLLDGKYRITYFY